MEGSPVFEMCKDRMAMNTKLIVDSCVSDAQVNTFDIMLMTEIGLLNWWLVWCK